MPSNNGLHFFFIPVEDGTAIWKILKIILTGITPTYANQLVIHKDQHKLPFLLNWQTHRHGNMLSGSSLVLC